MSVLQKMKRSADESGQLQSELSSDQTIVPPRQEPSHVFSNISASDHSRQHVGHVYNTTNVNFADPDDAVAKRIIDSLYFPDIERRRDAIGGPAEGTYEWLLRPESPALEAIAEARDLWEDTGSGASSQDEVSTDNEDGVPASEEDNTATDDEVEEEPEERRRRELREEATAKLTDWLQAKDGVFWIV